MNSKTNTLFHFTKSGDALQRILLGGFWPRYCLEDIRWVGFEKFEFMAFPMVSFCDIPISRLDEHVGFYGSYGIGMTKEWAAKNGLNPVFYIGPDGPLSTGIIDLMSCVDLITEDGKDEFTKGIRHLSAFIKPLSGQMIVRDKPVPKHFYAESEWRYIPRSTEIQEFLLPSAFSDEGQRDAANASTNAHCMLRFVPSDIRYIFVPDDGYIPETINFIQSRMDMFPGADQKLLMSRVTSLETLRADV